MDLSQFSKGATEYTKAFHKKYLDLLPFEKDTLDFKEAAKGFVGATEADGIYHANGRCLFNFKDFAGVNKDSKCPDTVNPSLWRKSILTQTYHGLFEVAPGVYQVRGEDVANLTIFEGDTGIVLLDVCMTQETAKSGLELYYKLRGFKEIKAVLVTHSHIDHYAGLGGLVSQEDIDSGKIPVVVPEGFFYEYISENAYAGTAMPRRAQFQFAMGLPRGAKGFVDGGMGQAIGGGTITTLRPSMEIKEDIETHTFDGIEVVFTLCQETEAPSEMTMYLPKWKMLITAEIVTHSMHQALTLRGAKIRDTRLWWKAIDKLVTLYGDKTEIIAATHLWPFFGAERCKQALKDQRDAYKYLHDQTLRLINQGLTPVEITDKFDNEIPGPLGQIWHTRGTYGSVLHNARAIYQYYIGWYSMNPADFNPPAPENLGKNMLAAFGEDKMVQVAKDAFNKGDYRFASYVGNQIVFGDPENKEAREVTADAYEQMGYQCENGIIRNMYLTAAVELRIYPKITTPNIHHTSPLSISSFPEELLYEFLSLRIDGPATVDTDIKFHVTLTSGKTFLLELARGVLNFHEEKSSTAQASIVTDNLTFANFILKAKTVDELIADGSFKVEGDKTKLEEFMSFVELPKMGFNIVTP